MKTEDKEKSFESSSLLQIITLVAGLTVTIAFLVLEPSLKLLSEYISTKGLWIAGMVSLASSSLLGIINKQKRFSQMMTLLSLSSIGHIITKTNPITRRHTEFENSYVVSNPVT